MPYTLLTSEEEGPIAIVFDKKVTSAHMIAVWCTKDDSLVAKVAMGFWADTLNTDIFRHPEILVEHLQQVRKSQSEHLQQIKESIKAQRRLARQWVTKVAMMAFEAGLLHIMLCTAVGVRPGTKGT